MFTKTVCLQLARRFAFSVLISSAWYFLLLAGAQPSVLADSNYYQHTFFDTSLTSDSYFSTRGQVSPPSVLQLDHGKLPVETKTVLSPPNALRLAWTSAPGVGWDAEIDGLSLPD